jgi:CRISPR-associated protein Csb2
MAMAAAHFETGADPAERWALEWLEAAPSPAVRASDAFERSPVRTYVPVNDVQNALAGRSRQDRAFLRVRPHNDSVYLVWNNDPEPLLIAALESICLKVTRIGHSISAVQMWVVPSGQEPAPTWVPDTGITETRLRVPSSGTMSSLEQSFNGAAIQKHDVLAEAIAAAKGKEKARLKGNSKQHSRTVARNPGGRRWSRGRAIRARS